MPPISPTLDADEDLANRLQDLGNRIDAACVKHGVTSEMKAAAKRAARERALTESLKRFGWAMQRANANLLTMSYAIEAHNTRVITATARRAAI